MRLAHAGIAVLTLATMGLGGCMTAESPRRAALAAPILSAPVVNARYASLGTEPFPIAAVDPSKIPAQYLRSEVDYATTELPGTIVIDTAGRHLYLVQPNGRAIRYGVGVGKQGMSWSGVATVGNKRMWPDWYPPKEMIARRPDIENSIQNLPSGRGLPGGVGNPLGARAMYLYKDGKDTLYRIHGTLEPYTMGQAVSSGCIRMINQDAIDLFSRVDVGAKVVVLSDAPAGPAVAEAEVPDYGRPVEDRGYGRVQVPAQYQRRDYATNGFVPPADVGYPRSRAEPYRSYDPRDDAGTDGGYDD